MTDRLSQLRDYVDREYWAARSRWFPRLEGLDRQARSAIRRITRKLRGAEPTFAELAKLAGAPLIVVYGDRVQVRARAAVAEIEIPRTVLVSQPGDVLEIVRRAPSSSLVIQVADRDVLGVMLAAIARGIPVISDLQREDDPEAARFVRRNATEVLQ